VDVGLYRLGAEEGLAQAHQPLVGVDQDEEDIRELVKAQRVYLDDLHCSSPWSGTRPNPHPVGLTSSTHTSAMGNSPPEVAARCAIIGTGEVGEHTRAGSRSDEVSRT
jgi:hypothetical protein